VVHTGSTRHPASGVSPMPSDDEFREIVHLPIGD
jgi:hypothetical protein